MRAAPSYSVLHHPCCANGTFLVVFLPAILTFGSRVYLPGTFTRTLSGNTSHGEICLCIPTVVLEKVMERTPVTGMQILFSSEMLNKGQCGWATW